MYKLPCLLMINLQRSDIGERLRTGENRLLESREVGGHLPRLDGQTGRERKKDGRRNRESDRE